MKLLIFFLIIPVQLVWQLHDGHGFDSREKIQIFFIQPNENLDLCGTKTKRIFEFGLIE